MHDPEHQSFGAPSSPTPSPCPQRSATALARPPVIGTGRGLEKPTQTFGGLRDAETVAALVPALLHPLAA